MPSADVAPWLTIVTVSLRDDDALSLTCASVDRQAADGFEHVIVLAESPGANRGGTGQDRARRTLIEPPVGVYSAMNVGLRSATGVLVQFLNAGDEYAADDVLGQVRTRFDARGFQWAYGRMLVARFPGDPGKVRGVTLDDMESHGYRGMHFPEHPTVFARADLLRQLGGFDTSYRTAADYRLLLELATSHPGEDLDLVVTRYSLGGVSDVSWRRSVQECHRARMDYFKPTRMGTAREKMFLASALAEQALRRIVRAARRRPTRPSMGSAL